MNLLSAYSFLETQNSMFTTSIASPYPEPLAY